MRNGEEQLGMGDVSRRDDAFSRAILDEKDPVIRGYMENLRAQIATIAAKHGANARDVWNKEVQDRMSVDEMDAVNDLFKRIKGIGEKKLRTADAREMLKQLEEKEAWARDTITSTFFPVGRSAFAPSREFETEFMDRLLVAGIPQEIERMFKGFLLKLPNRQVDYNLALAALCAESDPKRSRALLEKALREAQRWMSQTTDGCSAFVLVCDRLVRACSDDELRESVQLVFVYQDTPSEFLSLRRLLIEFERRGLTDDADVARETMVRRGWGRFARLQTRYDMAYLLACAEMDARCGIDPRVALREAIGVETDPSTANRVSSMTYVARTAERVGASDIVDEILLPGRPRGFLASDAVVLRAAVEGCIAGKRFERAIAHMTSGKYEVAAWSSFATVLIREMLDSDQIERVERLLKDYPGLTDPEWHLWTDPRYLAARAARGDSVEDTVVLLSHLNHGDLQCRAKDMAFPAIATLGYVAKAKKRIAEYAKR